MAAVSNELLETIKELQSLNSLNDAYLRGGTSLAVRYNHRISVDIDLFFSGIIGKDGYKAIEVEVNKHFEKRVSNLHYPCDESDQYIFLRFWIKTKKEIIKVEIMQNVNFLDEAEELSGVRVASVRDVGLMKLIAVSNRASQKDVYDLDYLTEEISIQNLFKQLKKKQEHFNSEAYRTIFDKDGKEVSPVDNPLIC
jgi:predicted nucleotidyltransferase component of viral defense system